MQRMQCGVRPQAAPAAIGSPHFALPHAHPSVRHARRTSIHCQAKKKAVGGLLRDAVANPTQGTNLAFLVLGNYLRSLGIEAVSDVTRVLDLCTNPNSIFGSKGGRRNINPHARKLTVEEMQAVVAFLEGSGFVKEDIVRLILEFPQVLCYRPDDRLRPLFDYLTAEIGLSEEQVLQLVRRRPVVLGLQQDNVERMVGYLQENGASAEEVVKLLESSL